MLFLQPPTSMKALSVQFVQEQINVLREQQRGYPAPPSNKQAPGTRAADPLALTPLFVFQALQGCAGGKETKKSLQLERRLHRTTTRPRGGAGKPRRYGTSRSTTDPRGDGGLPPKVAVHASRTKSLFISNETLDMLEIGALQSMLSTNTFLTELKLSNLCFAGATQSLFGEAIVRGLSNNIGTKLEKLSMINCGLTDETVVAFAEKVLARPDSSLTHLDLSENSSVRTQGILALFQALEKQRRNNSLGMKTSRLSSLFLRDTGLTADTIQQLAQNYLPSCPLEHLNLCSVDLLMPVSIWQNVANALQQNIIIQTMTLGVYDLGSSSSPDMLLLLCAEPAFIEALDRCRYYLQRNRMIKTLQKRAQHVTIAEVVDKVEEKERHDAKLAAARTPSRSGCVPVEEEHFGLSVLYDWILQHPQALA